MHQRLLVMTSRKSSRKTEFESRRLQLLNFESSNQSIFHSVLPIGVGLALVREDVNAPELSCEEDDEEEEEDSEEEEA